MSFSPNNEYLPCLSISGMIWGSAIRENTSDGPFCLLLPYIFLFPIRKHTCSHIRCCGSGHGNLVRIDHCGGIGVGMTKLCRRCHQIHTVGNHGRSRSMPEGVWMDMRQPVPVAEAIQPVTDTVRVHPLPIVLNEYIGCICPAVAVQFLQSFIFRFPLLQNLQRLGCDLHRPNFVGFGGAFICFAFQKRKSTLPRRR